jgi:hypothetical protein
MSVLERRIKISWENIDNVNKNIVAIKEILLQPNFKWSNSLKLIVLMSLLLIVTTIISNTQPLFVQHHGAPPPMATLGDRNISMHLVIEPKR